MSSSASTASPDQRDISFNLEMDKSFQEDQLQLKLAKTLIIFKDSKFVFQKYGSEKGISCYRNEAVKTAQMLPEMIRILKKVKESLEIEKARRMAESPENYDPEDENEKRRYDRLVRSEIIQKNKSFEKLLAIQIYKGYPYLGLLLYLLDTNDGIPRPCPGSALFTEEDDADKILAFIEKCQPKQTETQGAWPRR
jgi:hypothetical protein